MKLIILKKIIKDACRPTLFQIRYKVNPCRREERRLTRIKVNTVSLIALATESLKKIKLGKHKHIRVSSVDLSSSSKGMTVGSFWEGLPVKA